MVGKDNGSNVGSSGDDDGNDVNDCEFIIDTFAGKDDEEDTFPTLLVAQRARRIVRKCMVGGVEGRESLGAESVGPKRVVVVVLVKRIPGALGGLNRTGGMLEIALNGSSGLGDGLESY